MTEVLQFLCVPAITIAVYAVIAVINKAVGENEKFKRFIPLLALILGVFIGVICYYALPEVLSASSLAMAIVMGGASGLAATGGDQIIKQLTKNTTSETTDTATEEATGEISVEELANTLADSVVSKVINQLETTENDKNA